MMPNDLITRNFPDDDNNNNGFRPSRMTWLMIAGVIGFVGLLAIGYAIPKGSDGELPVVTADGEDMSGKPDDAGGMDIPHQDATIYNELDANNQQAKIEQIMPGAEEPILPTANTSAPIVAAPDAPVSPAPMDMAANNTAPQAIPSAPAPAATAPVATAPMTATTPAPITQAPVATAPTTAPAAIVAAPVTPAPAPATTAPAPSKTAALEPTTIPTTPAVEKTAPVAKATAPTGTGYRVQLASVGSETAASSEWQKIAGKHKDVLGMMKSTTVKADIPGKGTFYRIQAGPLGEAQARSLCDQLKSRSQPCMVVKGQ